MDLKEHYLQLYKTSIPQISSGKYDVDPWIKADSDERFGLSLIIRPSTQVKEEIQKFLSKLKKEEPNQYYYPSSDIHITLLSIISCHEGFDIDQIKVPQYISLIEEALVNLKSFKIRFEGITASTSCIMIQGFMENNEVNSIRDHLRKAFKTGQLPQSIDLRYTRRTAHATVFRFSETLKNKNTLLTLIEKYRNHDFGAFEVNTIELVVNDWYQRASRVQQLHYFKLVK